MCSLTTLLVRLFPLPFLLLWAHAGATNEFLDGQTLLNPSLAKNCTKSHLTTNDIVDGDVSIAAYDALSNNEFPKMAHLNASAWELWFFDAVSPSGDAAITISFFRDGSQSAMGRGNLRAQFLAIWPDKSTFRIEYYPTDSIIESCPGEPMRASWRGEDESTSFEISHDLMEAVVRLDLAEVQGILSLSSTTAKTHADGNPSHDVSRMLAPTVYWLQPIPRASVDVKLTIDGKELRFAGFGGHDRFWTPYSWMTLMDESYYMRAVAGPYTAILLRIISRVDPGRTYASAFLFEGGQQVFASQNEQISLNDDYVSFKLSYHGVVQGEFRDTNTGYVLEMVSPTNRRHWRFEMDHARVWWNLPTGPVTGNTGFIDRVAGGEIGGEQHQGAGSAGQCQLPSLAK